MASSHIEWTQQVWNPTTGCDKVSQGCKNCYAEIMHRRLLGIPKMSGKYNSPFLGGAQPHEPSLLLPMQWKKGKNIFVDSMSDLFHQEIVLPYIAKVYAVMYWTPQHIYQLLTKRPQRREAFINHNHFASMVFNAATELGINGATNRQDWIDNFRMINVWEGTSVEDQKTAEERIPVLMKTNAHVKWISMEPMLGPIDLSQVEGATDLNWIVVGGESGPKKRPFDPDWARAIKEFCWEHDIAFYMKQWDKVKAIPEDLFIRDFPGAFQSITH